MKPEIFRLTEPSRKSCEFCSKTFKDGDVVFPYTSSVFHSNSHSRWAHLLCFLRSGKALISKEQYSEVYDEWLVGRV